MSFELRITQLAFVLCGFGGCWRLGKWLFIAVVYSRVKVSFHSASLPSPPVLLLTSSSGRGLFRWIGLAPAIIVLRLQRDGEPLLAAVIEILLLLSRIEVQKDKVLLSSGKKIRSRDLDVSSCSNTVERSIFDLCAKLY
ncbi:hypothetical protein AVEN_163841-1 [Araneus ventricosus]|nr:hypothetical protein AVEN_97253-1 [Araneus ventricosus]GBO18280.1 hypothetical protein AVEN_185834-1 [Araneus ventricosus]GBO25042.1 hypothetical protein AVEN_163841-1 [Araneus ventricosus]